MNTCRGGIYTALGLLTLLSGKAAQAQDDCFGLANSNCIGTWVSQLGYHRRIDGGNVGLNRLTWQFGPQVVLTRHGVGIGGSVITAFDDDSESQWGLNVRGFRTGKLGIQLGVGVLLSDSRRGGGDFSLTANAAVSVMEHLHLVGTLDAFERTPRQSESRVYIGARVLKFDSSMFLPSLAITFVAFIATIFVD